MKPPPDYTDYGDFADATVPLDMAVHANDEDDRDGSHIITIIALAVIAVVLIGAGIVLWSLSQ